MVTLGPFLVGLACLAASTAVVAKGLESTSPGAPVISGSGAFRYQYDPTKLLLPPTVQLLNGHGLARDRAGNIYFTYESTDKTAASVRALIRYSPDGSGGELLGDATLAQGVPHGLKIAVEGGVEYLYHGNNAATVSHARTKPPALLSAHTQRAGPRMRPRTRRCL